MEISLPNILIQELLKIKCSKEIIVINKPSNLLTIGTEKNRDNNLYRKENKNEEE